MSTPTTCRLNEDEKITFVLNKETRSSVALTGDIEVIWNHRTGDVTDVLGFEIWLTFFNEREPKGNIYCDQMELTTGIDSEGKSPLWDFLTNLIPYNTIVELAQEYCEHEPPTDGTLQDEIDYQENLDDFYPPIPRG